jgi:hypothetical protein
MMSEYEKMRAATEAWANQVDKARAWDAVAEKSAEIAQLRAEIERLKKLKVPVCTECGDELSGTCRVCSYDPYDYECRCCDY